MASTSTSTASLDLSRTAHLRSRAHAFCTAFTSNTPPTDMLDQFFTHSPNITEHGPAWAQSRLPFLGKTFVGRRRSHRQKTPTASGTRTGAGPQTQTQDDSSLRTSASNPESEKEEDEREEGEDTTSCDAYFSLLSQTLTFHPTANTFPPEEDIVVDAAADGGRGVVSVVGRGRFESVRTGRGWEEEFIWRLGGWDEEGRVGTWEVWADPLSAWVAVGGAGEGDADS